MLEILGYLFFFDENKNGSKSVFQIECAKFVRALSLLPTRIGGGATRLVENDTYRFSVSASRF